MAEHAAAPDALLADLSRMQPYVAASLAYAQTLKAKPATGPRKA